MGFNRYTRTGVTAPTAVVTCPADTVMIVIGTTIANTSGTLTSVNILAGGANLLKSVEVGEGSAIVPIGGEQKVVLVTGDSLVVEATEEVDVHVSVLEQTV
jgi:hypothetical protein